MRTRRIVATLLVLALLLVCLPMQTFAEVAASGTCGENLIWKFTDDGTLTISGTGAMTDYPFSAAPEALAPWRSFESYIKGVVIENGVTHIGDCAFVGLSNLTSVSIADSVTAMGNSVFSNCESLKTVTIPDSVVNMGRSVFTDCSALESVTLSRGLTALEHNVFERCRALERVVIPESVNSIAYGVFRDCTGLKEIRFLGSAPTIDDQAFGNVTTSAFYRASDPSWTEEVKQDYGGTLMWFGVGDPAVDTIDTPSGFCGTATTWKLENDCLTISGTGIVEEVAWKAVKHKIRKVVIEEGVTNIVSEAFSYCTELTDITISDTVTAVGSGAFAGCTGLKKVVLPENVTRIGYRAFAECTSLTQIVIPDTVSEIGQMAFEHCTSLKRITLPEKLCAVEYNLFFNATALESIVIPNGVQYIAGQAFCGCKSLKSVEIPASVSYIADKAFAFCSSLSSITFHGNAPEFRGNYPFEGVTATAYYPAGNETWTSGAMMTYNANLKWVAKRGIQQTAPVIWTLEDGVLTIYRDTDIIFWENRREEIHQVVIHDGVTAIGERWFAGCTNLTSVTIPESVKQIEYGAFWGMTNMKECVIPSGVNAVGNYAFSNCTGLKKVTFLGQKPSFENDGAFENVAADVYYFSDDVTWTEAARQNYGGDLTWIPYCRTHTYTAVVTEADCVTPGAINQVCSVCNMVAPNPEILPPQGHDYGLAENGKDPDFWDTTCDVCGAERVVDKHRPTHSMYRMYNPNSGEHFYTGSMEERKNLEAAGWKYEGVGFTFPATTGKPVYRLYDRDNTMEHLYTMDEAEKDALLAQGWVLEGIAFNSGREDEVPQYRLHNPNATIGAYHFTASVEEKDALIAAGWEYQGIGFYTCLQ